MILTSVAIGFSGLCVFIWLLMRQQKLYIQQIEIARLQVEQSLNTLKELIEQ